MKFNRDSRGSNPLFMFKMNRTENFSLLDRRPWELMPCRCVHPL